MKNKENENHIIKSCISWTIFSYAFIPYRYSPPQTLVPWAHLSSVHPAVLPDGSQKVPASLEWQRSSTLRQCEIKHIDFDKHWNIISRSAILKQCPTNGWSSAAKSGPKLLPSNLHIGSECSAICVQSPSRAVLGWLWHKSHAEPKLAGVICSLVSVSARSQIADGNQYHC